MFTGPRLSSSLLFTYEPCPSYAYQCPEDPLVSRLTFRRPRSLSGGGNPSGKGNETHSSRSASVVRSPLPGHTTTNRSYPLVLCSMTPTCLALVDPTRPLGARRTQKGETRRLNLCGVQRQYIPSRTLSARRPDAYMYRLTRTTRICTQTHTHVRTDVVKAFLQSWHQHVVRF